MSQQQYNNLLNNILKEKQAFTSLRAQLEERRERECWSYRKFRYLAHNCKTKKEERKEKEEKPQNRYEILVTRVMQCEVRNEVEMRHQERKKEVKYFRYWGIEHHKWECPNIKVERQRRKSKQMPHVVGL